MMIKNIHALSSDGQRVRTSDLAVKTELQPATVTEQLAARRGAHRHQRRMATVSSAR